MGFNAEDLVALRRLQGVAFSKQGDFAVVELSELDKDKAAYVSQLWKVDLKKGEKHQMTFGEFSSRAPAFGPHDELFFLSNRSPQHEDEKHKGRFQVYLAGSGDPVQVSVEPLGVASFQVDDQLNFVVQTTFLPGVEREEQRSTHDEISKKGPSALRYTSTPIRFWDHWIGRSKSNFVAYKKGPEGEYIPSVMTRCEKGVYKNAAWTLSKDGQFILTSYRHYFQASQRKSGDRLDDTRLRKISTLDGEQEEIFGEEGHWVQGLILSKDSKQVCYIDYTRLPDRFGSYALVLVNLETKKEERWVPDFDGDISIDCFSDDGKFVYFLADKEATRSLFSLELSTQKIVRLSDHGSVHSFVAKEKEFLGLYSSIKNPPELFKMDDSGFEILTNLSGFVFPDGIQISNHQVKSTDGSQVQFYRAYQGEPERSMLAIHGGPVGHWGDVWHWRWNVLVFSDMGYDVFMPNPRGSTGFGQDFVDGIFGSTWGAQCYEDLMCVTDEILEISDAKKAIAMGGSFGGYMTNWIGTQTDRFDALMTHAGLFDLHQFYSTTDGPAYWSRIFQQNVYEERTAFDTHSPARFVSNWKTPTLVIHGEKDYRVPISEALYLFDALQYFEVESELVIFPDENHWILKPKNIVYWYDAIARFFDKVLD